MIIYYVIYAHSEGKIVEITENTLHFQHIFAQISKNVIYAHRNICPSDTVTRLGPEKLDFAKRNQVFSGPLP